MYLLYVWCVDDKLIVMAIIALILVATENYDWFYHAALLLYISELMHIDSNLDSMFT